MTEQTNIPALPDSTQIEDEDLVGEGGIDWKAEVEGDIEIQATSASGEEQAEGSEAPVEGVSGTIHQNEATDPNAPAVSTSADVATQQQAPIDTAEQKPATTIHDPTQPQPKVEPQQPFDQAAWETEQLSALSKIYGLAEEDAEAMLTEPAAVLPKLAAQLHMNITKTVLSSLQSIVPQIVAQQNVATTREKEATDAFYAANQDLIGHEQAVLQVGQMFRAANPNADRATAIRMIGEMTRLALGKPLMTTAPAPTPSPTLPVSTQRPFTPSVGGTVPAPVKPKNEWEDLL